jgi:hypothetical protein
MGIQGADVAKEKVLKTVPKISVKIWRPIIQKLDDKLEAACLRRDAYLRRVLEVELEWLEHEVCLPNSSASYDFVFEHLDSLDRKLVSLALPQELTRRLNEICARKRIVRDAFFNRLFLLLCASPRTVDALLFPNVADEWRRDVWSEYQHDGPFFQNGFYPLEQDVNPFWAIRSGLQLYADEEDLKDYVEPESGTTVRVSRDILGSMEPPYSVYTAFFDMKHKTESLLGLNCWVPDWRIPGHQTALAHQKKVDDIIAEMGVLK